MKKLLTKMFCLVLSIACVFTSFGCGNGKGGENIDSTKTQIYVGIVSNGYGKSWLEAAAQRFTEIKADYEGVNGKKGVQVVIGNVAYGGTLISSITNVREHVIFTGDVNIEQWVSNGHMVDIDAMVKEDLSKFNEGESGSIESKMEEEVRELYKIDGKYHALPYVSSDFGISYDKDIWEELGLYFAAADPDSGDYTAAGDAEVGYDFVDNKIFDTKSCGPDGIAGNDDDGLPATYDQFFALCEQIKTSTNVNPIIIGGGVADYIKSFLGSLYMKASGKEFLNAVRKFDFTGIEKQFVTGYEDLNGNNKADIGELTITSDSVENITSQTPQYLWQTPNFYYPIYFLDEIVDRGYMHAKSFDKNCSHLFAQEYFLKGTAGGYKGFDKVAMLIEGNYWENEATPAYNSISSNKPELGKQERNLGWLPLPHPLTDAEFKSRVENDTVPKNTYGVMDSAVGFVNPHTTKGDAQRALAIEFLQYLFTEQSLVDFTVETSMYRPLDYTLDQTDLDKMTPFGRDYIKMRLEAENACGERSTFFNNNKDHLSDAYEMFYTTFDTGLPLTILNKSGKNAFAYYQGMLGYYTNYSWIK